MKKAIDLHVDTLTALGDNDFAKNNLHYDLEKMEKGNVCTTLFAIFIDKKSTDDMWKRGNEIHQVFLKILKQYPEKISQVINLDDFNNVLAHEKFGAVLSTEGGGIIQGDLDKIKILQEWGVRAFSYTWNNENELAYPNSRDSFEMSRHLKKLGFEAIEALEEANILIDVSHLNEGGFFDIAENCHRPFLATHSNCREITNHPRNLTDKQIKILSDKGGVMGLNFCHTFVEDDGKTTFEGLSQHVLHSYKKGGSQVLALGTDFDGISGEMEPKNVSYLPQLYDYLKKKGLKNTDLDNMFQNNAKRVLFG